MAFDMLQRAAGIHACSDNKEEFQEYLTPASGSEAIFEQGFSFAEAASSQSVSFEAGYQWTAELSGEDIGWCSINPAKGLSGKATNYGFCC